MNENRIKHSSLSINAKTRFINTLSTLNRRKPLQYTPLSLRLEQTQEESEITSQTHSESPNDSKNLTTTNDESTNYLALVSPATKASLKLPTVLFQQVSAWCYFKQS
jgi:hypothetical protein